MKRIIEGQEVEEVFGPEFTSDETLYTIQLPNGVVVTSPRSWGEELNVPSTLLRAWFPSL